MTENDILLLIRKDKWMIEVLKNARELKLFDWWIGAGFVRSKVWDYLHGYTKRTPIPDIDVIYFDKKDFSDREAGAFSTKSEKKHEKTLKRINPKVNWSVTNQARMHIFHNDPPYKNSAEGLSRWVETATCIGATMDENDDLKLTTPHGTDDLVNLLLRPTSDDPVNIQTFHDRIEKKKWLEKWPKLKVV